MDNTTTMDHAEFTARRSLPMMALRGLTVFPGMMLTFEVERSMSIAALNMAMSDDQIIYLVPQKDIATDIPTPDDVYGVGTVCRIKQMMKQPGTKTIRVMAEGIERGRTLAVRTDMPCFVAEVEPMPDVEERKTARTEALIRHCCNLFDAYVTASGNMAPESVISVLGSTNAAFVSNFISQHVFLRPEEKQELLEETRPSRRLSKLSKMLLHETSVLGLQHQLEEAAQDRLNQTQQEYLLREQMKIIQAELGESDDPDSESADYREKILALHLPADSEQRLLKEVDRLKKQPFGSSEAAVIRNYLDICLELPWNTRTKETLDVRAAREVLDKEHFGLEKVKDRITEYLAVRQLAPDVKGGVLCLVGPPGTGKTSIAMSIAHATNRKLARISLGGVHDEAEIRGHRKTYVGAMPGRIINGLTIAGSMNPVMVLDEIDKLGSDYRGDPSSALLEVLDAEQNDHFRDNFMEIPVDLSDVFFILTANTLDTIPRPLLDRMEVIQLSSYTDEEKLQIAKQHLLPKQLKACGLTGKVTLSQSALYGIIDGYTREAGVRNLERTITSVLRKCARKIASGEAETVSVTGSMLEDLLGPRFVKPDFLNRTNAVGIANGLAWTSVGGETLPIEVQVMDNGSGKITVTGSLGDVMKESAQLAVTWVRVHAAEYGIDPEKLKKCDLHIHAPEGAVPKDGPSAGVTLTTALVSCLSGIPVRGDVAMTGEITLHGNVLPIGGLREKSMAAYREGMKTVLIPKDNEPDLYDVDDEVKKSLTFLPMQSLTQVLNAALLKPQNAKKAKAPSRTHAKKKAADAAIVPPTAEKPQPGAVC